ncbi:hypothetical protein [Thermaerobacillus caldiproteolyticus]|nr:hypothetical protein [Anoxybacillus caldiproteolyticus]
MSNKEMAKCANCGKEMEVVASNNWELYCSNEECRKVFMEKVKVLSKVK